VMNPANTTYTVSDPPLWIPEEQERHQICRELLYLHELAGRESTGVVTNPSIIVHRPSFSVFPNPCRGSAVLHWTAGPLDHSTTLRIYDATGRFVSSFVVRGSSSNVPVPAAAGVYLLRVDSGGRFATARLVVD